ncbi:MAG: HD domain-containing protein [Proteobacteria bacterium]|nr:HD domain-containing protein [Pseudomonadota bacterium]MBU1140311.1 HD domain-containing protein [Pseudomonadota bacterium]MBU1232692.1 HD domain-containing protein [Pseudomonadota bacterium]MBU1418853.1 HD domain-containing protein [Pseudomonadota bacterium]MBU1455723.1 HD domain-containing protein [Pseudomonadota bacterium]
MTKTQFVKDLQEGDRVDDLFLVKSSRLAETRAGKPYLQLAVMDRSGEITGPIWERAEELAPHCQSGSFIHLQGLVQSYRQQLQLKIDALQPWPRDEVCFADFVPSCSKNREEMAGQLQCLVRSVDNPYLKKLLNRFLKKEPMWQRFQESPAAKGIHHAYLGGLLEHSLSVAVLAETIAAHYPGVDRSLLITGALLHDVGKVEELQMDLALIEYTSRGRLKGHLVMGSEMVAAEAAGIKDFPGELLEQLQHLILSHHGRQEFGSPTVPMTIEAFLLSFLDDLDAKMNLMEQLRANMTESGLQWTEYQRSLERFLYLSPMPAKEEQLEEESNASPSGRQQTLF